MGNLSEHAYAFPFIAGIIAIIALVCPAAYYSTPSGSNMGYGILVWMFGLVVYRNKGQSRIYWFNTDAGEYVDIFGTEFFGFITSMACTAVIAMSAIVFMITAQRVKHGSMGEDKAAKVWAIMAILMIVASITWLISVEYYYGIYSANIDKGYPAIVKFIFGSGKTTQFGFWSFFSPTFGIIGPLLAAAIALIGVYVK